MSNFIKLEEQENVLNSSGKNILVSASAGSGKTSLLIRKIIKILSEEKISVNELLVLTYTKAAATELKKRLEESLMERIDEPIFRNLLDEISTADISTFHSFCQKILKKYAFLLSINAEFNILDENQTNFIKNKALINAIKIFQKSNEQEFENLFSIYGKNKNYTSIGELIMKINQFNKNNINNDLLTLSYKLFENKKAENIINNYICNQNNYYIEKLKKLQTISHELSFNYYVENINKVLSQIEIIKEQNTLSTNLEIINSYTTPTLKQSADDENNFVDEIKIVKVSLKKFYDKMKEKNFGNEQDIANSYVFCKQIINSLVSINDIFEQEYKQEKDKIKSLDYDDLEMFTIKALENEQIREELKTNYRYIFVDEYQDANIVQEIIISLLAKRNNRFIVGDIKQSIYGFRNSNPDIFIDLQKKYEEDEFSQPLTLNANFRSDKKILDFVNVIFEKIMSTEISGVDYKNTSMLNGLAEYQDNGPAVSLNIIDIPENEIKRPTGLYGLMNLEVNDEKQESALREAHFIASEIAKLVSFGKVYDKDLKKFRSVNFDDITILLRSRGDYQEILSSYLAEQGIPVLVNSNQNLFKTEEGQMCLNLLKTCDNSQDDYALVNTMLSPIFMFTENELAQVKLEFNSERYFYKALSLYGENFENALAMKIQSFFEELNSLRFKLKIDGIYNTLFDLFSKSDIYETFLSYPNAEIKISYLNGILSLFKNNNISLTKLLENPDLIAETPALAKVSSAVNITTMHASKGLEYPIVFISNLNQEFSREKKETSLAISKELGVATKYYDLENRAEFSSVFMEAIKLGLEQENLAEKIRLLYVALTRAKNKLYLIGSTKDYDYERITDEHQVMFKKSYLDLIVSSLTKDCIDAIKSHRDYQDPILEINTIQDISITKLNKNIYHSLEKVDNENVNNLKKYLTKNYANFEATRLAYKNSVSSLNKKDDFSSDNYTPQYLTITEHKPIISSDKLGTLYHKILELADFNTNFGEKELQDIYNKLLITKFASEEELKEIDKENVLKNINLLASFSTNKTILKEQKFILKTPYSSIMNSKIEDKILVQGIVDLLLCGSENILIDYKLTSIVDDNKLIKTYYKQLMLYKLAMEKALKRPIQKVFILNLRQNKLIEIK